MLVGQCASNVLQFANSVKSHTKAKTETDIAELHFMEVPENGHIAIRVFAPQKVTGSLAQMKCVYTSAHSVGNKQEEMHAILQQGNYDIVAITET